MLKRWRWTDNSVAVINAANAKAALREYAESSCAYVKAQSLQLPDAGRHDSHCNVASGWNECGRLLLAGRAGGTWAESLAGTTHPPLLVSRAGYIAVCEVWGG
jgi:hypothetical protein